MSSKDSLTEHGKVTSPRVDNTVSSPMESSSSWSRSYTSHERESKNVVRTPDNTPPRPFALSPSSRAMLPRQLAFGPVGSQLKASTHTTKTFNFLQQNSPQASPQEKATGVPLSASYLQQNVPQVIPDEQTLGVPMSANYRPLHTFPSAVPTGPGFSPSHFSAPSVFQFRSNPDPWRFS